jgi:hypothetical protein
MNRWGSRRRNARRWQTVEKVVELSLLSGARAVENLSEASEHCSRHTQQTFGIVAAAAGKQHEKQPSSHQGGNVPCPSRPNPALTW